MRFFHKKKVKMFKKGRFPTEEEVAEKLERVQNFPAVIEELVERINGLLEINFDDLDSHQLKFVLGDLPGIFASLVSLKNQNRKNIKLINDFTFSYLCLTAKMELHIDLLHSVGNVFDSSMRKYVPVVTKSQTKTVKEQFFKFSPDFDYLKPQDIRPHCNQIVKEIIVQLFSSHLFEKAFSFINEQKMTPECFAEFINIYSGVESSLSESVISFMLPTILDETINLLLKNESDFSGMCHFLSVHFKCSKKHVLPIIQTLCKMTEVGKTTIRSSVVSEIIEISNIEGNEELISSNSQVIKETFINAISLNQNAIILKQIYSFFPKFSEICQFTDDNVKEILTKSSGTCPSDMIIKIIPNLHDNDLDSFANFLIKNNYFYPDLFSFLLTKVKKTQAYKLLDFILKNPERLRKEGLVDFEMSTTIMDYIIDITPTTPEMVESLSLFYLKAPTLEEFHNFIMETVKMFMECPQLIDVLNSFSSVMDKFDSTQTILQVFELVFESIEEEGAKSKLLPLIPVLSDWIAAKKDDIPINNNNNKKHLNYPFLELVESQK